MDTGFFNSPFDYGDDSIYTRNFVLLSLNDTLSVGPQVEVTLDLTEGGLSSLAPGLRANVGYGRIIRLVFLSDLRPKGDDETGIPVE